MEWPASGMVWRGRPSRAPAPAGGHPPSWAGDSEATTSMNTAAEWNMNAYHQSFWPRTQALFIHAMTTAVSV